MTTKTYALLDTHAVGPAMQIQGGGTIATCTVDGADIHRMIRATIGFASGQHRFQCAFYGDGDIAGKVSCGLVTDASSLSKYVGEEATSIGYLAGDGNVNSGGSPVQTIPATTKQIFIDVVLDADADTVQFIVNGSAFDPITITSGQTWYPAISVGSDVTAGDILGWFVSGANAFNFALPDLDWSTSTQGFGQVRLAGQTGYLTGSGDTPANTVYPPDMLEFDQTNVQRTCSVWPWANQSSGASYGTIATANDKGQYDFLQKSDPRDATVTMRLLPLNGTFADSFVVMTAVTNAVATDGEAINRITIGDTLARLQRQLQTKKFPPWADSGVANRPYPILLGACRSVAPLLVDEANRIYQVGDASINNIAVLRDQGDPLDPNATPADYVQTDDQQGVIPNVLPVGKFIGDFSSVGQQNVIPGAVDVLAGAGTFTTWTNPSNPPDGWTAVGTGTITRETSPQNYVARISTSDPWDPDGSGKIGKGIKIAAGLVPGKSYTFTLKVSAASGTIPQDPNINLWYGLRIVTALTNGAAVSVTPYNQPIRQPMWQGDLQYTLGPYTVPAGSTGDIYCVVSASTNGSPDTSTGTAFVDFYGIRVEEIAQSPVEVPLVPMSLTAFMTNIIEQRAGLTSADWVAQDAIDIDERTGYKGIGWYQTEPITIEGALRAVCDSYCAVIFTDHLGRIRVRQLIDPDTIDDGDIVMELDGSSIEYPMNCTVDAATGLTTSMLSQKNNYVCTDTDFISDTSSTTGIDYATRTQFKQDGRFLAVATVPIASYYQFATQAPPLLSLFDDPNDAQTEINRVNGLFSTTPNFYTFKVFFDGRNAQTLCRIIFGDGIKVTYDRYGLDEGKKMLIVDANIIPGDFSVQITAWRPST